MNTRLTIAIGVLAAFLMGCNTTPTSVVDADEPMRSIEEFEMIRGSSPRSATGHFMLQDVEATSPDGSVSTIAFRADFAVLSDGGARGNFSVSDGNSITIFRVNGGGVRCDDGVDVVVLNGIATEVTPGGEPTTRLFSATAMPVDEDNPECIIWDIKDSCSHEAQGDFNVIKSVCER